MPENESNGIGGGINKCNHLEVDAWCKVQHRMDILAEVINSITPHDEGHLHDCNDQDRDAGSIGVHDVQYILTPLFN